MKWRQPPRILQPHRLKSCVPGNGLFEHFLAAVFEYGVQPAQGNIIDRMGDKHLGPSTHPPPPMNPGWKLRPSLHTSGPTAGALMGKRHVSQGVGGSGGAVCLDGP